MDFLHGAISKFWLDSTNSNFAFNEPIIFYNKEIRGDQTNLVPEPWFECELEETPTVTVVGMELGEGDLYQFKIGSETDAR